MIVLFPEGRGVVTRLTVTEAVRNFSEILGRVRFRGERFMLLKGGKPVAELRPTGASASIRLGELPPVLEALPHLGSSEADRFARDLESSRKAIGKTPPAPWAS
jgi:antitoxin (DNA-binding transcriptional repressor) of toxin-antitoxin stability system